MLAKKYRLAKDNDIQTVFKKGKTFYGPFFNLKAAANYLTYSRFCIIVSTKISKKAVVRNQVKRRLRAIIYKNLPHLSCHSDFIIITKPSSTISSFHTMEASLTALLRAAGLSK